MKLNSRIPVIALDYSERHKATTKELLIDYETGNIYVVSSKDKSVIFDITSKILEKIDNLTGDKIIVDIEGIGEINLVDIINQLRLELDDTVTIYEEGNDVYVPKPERYDNKSIESKYNNIQIKNFETADNGMIPQKFNGSVRWVYPTESDIDSEEPGTPNPDDGLSTSVVLVEPFEGKLFLRASRRLMTKNLNKDCDVVLPRVFDEYTEIYWNVRTYSYRPALRFQNSVLFEGDTQPLSNSFTIYKFATWDSGETWFATKQIFNAP